MIISHVKIIAFQLSLFCKNYHFSKTVLYIINRKIHACLENTRFISRVEHDISLVRCAHSCDIMFHTRNKSHLVFPRTHACIILYNYSIHGFECNLKKDEFQTGPKVVRYRVNGV